LRCTSTYYSTCSAISLDSYTNSITLLTRFLIWAQLRGSVACAAVQITHVKPYRYAPVSCAFSKFEMQLRSCSMGHQFKAGGETDGENSSCKSRAGFRGKDSSRKIAVLCKSLRQESTTSLCSVEFPSITPSGQARVTWFMFCGYVDKDSWPVHSKSTNLTSPSITPHQHIHIACIALNGSWIC
jgi:hypothetical protein